MAVRYGGREFRDLPFCTFTNNMLIRDNIEFTSDEPLLTHAFVLPTTHPGTSEAAGSRAGQGTGLSTSQATSPSSAIHQRQGSP